MLLEVSIPRRIALPVIGVALAVLGASAASATNEAYQVFARSCSPYVQGGCEVQTSTQGGALNVGGAYAFAGGYNGGFATASASFQPGAPQLLEAGQYSEGSIGYMTYSFQVHGAPDTLVPLHMIGSVSVSPIHLSDSSGGAVVLHDGDVGPAPAEQWKMIGSASVQVSLSRGTSSGPQGASASVESSYDPSGSFGYCNNCEGGGDSFDTTIWVYSNSDINVTLNTSAVLQYQSDGPSSLNAIFGSVSGETDPVFSIDDPAFSGFTIVGVPSGSPPPAGDSVPEPSSWAMVIIGFGAVGGAMRTRRRTAVSFT